MRMDVKYPCPCCGYVVLLTPGAYEICPICVWEDDIAQLRFVHLRGGANKVSLAQAQQNYRTFGASEMPLGHLVRPPHTDEKRDSGWRPVDPTLDNIEDPIP